MKKLLFSMFALALLNGCASNSGNPQAESMIRIAHKARNSGNSEVAISFYNKALAIDPKNIDAYLGVADAHIDMNLLDAALGYIKKAEEAGAHKDRVHHIRGKIYLLQGNDKAAEKEFLNSSSVDSMNALGAIYDGRGEHDKAQNLYKQVIAKDPHYIDAYNNIGLSLMLSKKYKEAIFYLENTCSLPEANAAYRSNLALAYGLAGYINKAREVYQQDYDGQELEAKISYLEDLISSK